MFQFSCQRLNVGATIIALLSFASLIAAAQSQSVQSSSGQSSSAQSSSGQPSTGQSLADVARANQQEKAASTTTPKVFTNANLPKNPDGYVPPPANQDQNLTPSQENTTSSITAAEQRTAQERAAAHWRQQILAQKNKIADLEARAERLKAQIRFVDPNAYYDYYAGLAYNRAQAQSLERLREMEDQLHEQKQYLEEMQEAARHAGMHTKVYDP